MRSLHARNKDILEFLREPKTHRKLELHPKTIDHSGVVKEGIFLAAEEARPCGLLRNYKIDFTQQMVSDITLPNKPLQLQFEVEEFNLDYRHQAVRLLGDWQDVVPAFESDQGKIVFCNGLEADALVFRGVFTDIALRAYTCNWGGRFDVKIDGIYIRTICTFSERWGRTRYFCLAENLEACIHEVEIVPASSPHENSSGSQFFFRELIVTAPKGEYPDYERLVPYNITRTLPHDHRLSQVISNVPADGKVLEVGGGDRFISDGRYWNSEYIDDEFPGILCDALELPFADNTFDAVVSQAVLEHVVSPEKMALEMERVTKPGGTIWAGAAFMQTVHLAPWHYFNVTPYGMKLLFGHLEDFALEVNGGLAYTFYSLLDGIKSPDRFSSQRDQIMELAREIESQLSPDDMFDVASGVIIQGRKPLRVS